MNIAVIGTGNVGRALGTSWAMKGHQVIFGSRDPHSQKVADVLAAAGPNASAATLPEAGARAEVIVLATPSDGVHQVVEALGEVAGKIIVDATNPIGPGFQLAVGTTTSGAEQIAGWAKGGRVVKAFNTTGWENMADPIYHGEPITMFIGGDDAEAKTVVTGLAADLGFEVADTGPLSTARYLEPLAMVWIHLAIGQKQGRQIAFKIVRR
ncbi:MAG TPA: NADPH-dependent F420 reductase [Anaerolineae bacterium]|nr:NADPH-dependent F420 reductase [Anaerolineae bacterium]